MPQGRNFRFLHKRIVKPVSYTHLDVYKRQGLTFAVDEPAKVGRDRIADAAAAAEHYPLPCMTCLLYTSRCV